MKQSISKSVLTFAMLVLANPGFAAPGDALTAEQRINGVGEGLSVDAPDIAFSSATGAAVVVWTALGDSGPTSVRAQRYAPNGTPDGAEIIVSNVNIPNYAHPAVSMSRAGFFAVVWRTGYDADPHFEARFYQPDGRTFGSPERVNSQIGNGTPGQPLPAPAGDRADVVCADVGFSVVFETANGQGIRARSFRSGGGASSNHDTLISDTPEAYVSAPSVGDSGSGTAYIAWRGERFAPDIPVPVPGTGEVGYIQSSVSEIRIRRYSFETTPLSLSEALGASEVVEQRLGTHNNFSPPIGVGGRLSDPSVAVGAGGHAVVSYASTHYLDGGTSVIAQPYSSNGIRGLRRVVAGPGGTTAFTDFAAASIDAFGNSVVSWKGGDKVYGRRYNALGLPRAPSFVVNPLKLSNTGDLSRTAVAQSPLGNFAIAWLAQTLDSFVRFYEGP